MEKIKIIKNITASFDVDAQKCFTPLCPDELPVPDGHLIVDELNAQAKFARIRVGSKDAHSPNAVWVTKDPDYIAMPIGFRLGMKKDQIPPPPGPNVDVYWPVHAVPGTMGFELLDGLPRPYDYDYFVWKGMEPDFHPYGAAYHDLKDKFSTGVIEYLKGQGIVFIITGGLSSDFCVGTTALQLIDAKFRVIFNRAATKGISTEGAEAMIKKLEGLGAFIIDSTQDLELI
jgi:nicotinamidase/pyrazinamidase